MCISCDHHFLNINIHFHFLYPWKQEKIEQGIIKNIEMYHMKTLDVV